MFPVENPTLRISKESLAERLPDPVVGRMAKNSRNGEQDEDERQIQRAVFCSQCSDGKQQCVSREKWSHHQSGFGKDDQKKQCINPRSIGAGELIKIKVKVQNNVEEF